MLKAHKLLIALVILSTCLLSVHRTQAQEKPTAAKIANAQEEVFADFEGGTYDGWTLEGNCFGSVPASDTLFPGKISGFGGKHFVCTLDRRLGSNATGKAVSKEFTVSQLFINFLIGGGNHPKEACLNLVVDGKIIRTETGNDSPELRRRSWDVSLLLGMKAHFEIVDSTQSPERGYVMVDEISFSSLPRDKSLLDIESGPTLKQFGIQPYFWRKSTVKFSQIWGDSDLVPVFDFGVTPQVFKNLVGSVCVRAYRLPHDPVRPIGQTATLLCRFGEEELAKRGIANPSTLLKQWLNCEAFCAYVTSKVAYDYEIVERTLGKGTDLERERWRRQSVEIVYGLQCPLATCDGYSRITQKFAHLSGIKCWHIDGTTRQGHNGKANEGTNHGWVVFELDGGIRVPADTTIQWIGRPPDYARLKGKNGWRTMPATKRAWEIFNGEYYQTATIYEQKEPENLSLVSLSCDEWRAFNSIRHDDAKDYFDWEAGLQVGVPWKGTPSH